MLIRARTAAALLASSVVVCACGGEKLTVPTDAYVAVPVDSADPVAFGTFARLTWAPSSRELYYTSSESPAERLYVRDVVTGVTRVLDERVGPYVGYDAITVSPDGTLVYYATWDNDRHSIFVRPAMGGEPVQVTDHAGEPSFNEAWRQMTTSSVSNDLYFADRFDSLLAFSPAAKSTRVIASNGCRSVSRVSADAQEILCNSFSNYSRVSINGSRITPFTMPTAGSDFVTAMNLDGGTIRVFHCQSFDCFLSDANAGTTRRVPWADSLFGNFGSVAGWSRDGKTIGFWKVRCPPHPSQFACPVAEYALYLLDTSDLSLKRVAVVRVGMSFQSALSPDGRYVAYQSDGRLYLKALP